MNENEPQIGVLSVLNVSKGDGKLTFETEDDRAKAATTINDMIQRGYVILAEGPDSEWNKVTGYDPAINTYKIAGVPEGADASKTKATAVAPVAGG